MIQKRQGWLLSSLLVGGLSLLVNPAYGAFPLPPRLSGLVLASDYTVGQADAMFPLSGDMSRNLYVDPALSYGTDNQNQFDVGLGYRWITNQAAIVGGYFFGGYSRVDNNARLWIANPGIEAFGSRWDAHLNAYIPMGDRHYTAGTEIVHFFTGHSEFGRVFLMHQYAGSGADIKAGYQLFPNSSLKGYLGSYYFSPAETNNVWGGAAGLEYWLTQGVKLVGSYSYDNLHHSTYAFGIGLEWGGLRAHRADPALEERLTDPVERHVAELGRGSTIPTRLKAKPLLIRRRLADGNFLTEEEIVEEINNIAFFSQTGGPNNGGVDLTSANCTFENPCGPRDLSQASVNTLAGLLPNTQFYFNGGTYPIRVNNLRLIPGQSLHSRTADYSQPATGDARSIILGKIYMEGNNTLDNIILLKNPSGSPTDADGVTIDQDNNTIIGSQIGSLGDPVNVAVEIRGNNTRIDNSIMNASSEGVSIMPGLLNTTIQNSEINIRSNLGLATYGVNVGNGATVFITNTTIENFSFVIGSDVYGIQVGEGSRVNIEDTSISVGASNANEIVGLSGNDLSEVTMAGGEINLQPTAVNTTITMSSGVITFQGGTICTINGNTVTCS